MDERPSQRKAPSIFLGGVIGYAVATLAAALVSLWVAVGPRGYDNTVAFQLLFFGGAFGAFLGCDVTARVRKRRVPNAPTDEFQQFLRSNAAFLLAMLILAGAFGFSTLIALIYDASIGLPPGRK